MKIFLYYFFLLLILFTNTAFSQQAKLSGFVKDSFNIPLSLANVMAINTSNNNVVDYAITDEKGAYSLTLKKGQKYQLKFSYMGYRAVKTVVYINENDVEITKDITLYEDENQIEAVEIVYEMPVTVKGDTIIYKTDAFTNGKEKKLKDVLKKLPGIEVDKDGDVKVQGKKVSKLMVEGKDFFDGDPKLATKNIPANAIDKVEVLRNYSKIKQTRGLENEESIALNIKLKEGKKNIYFGDIELGVGVEKKHLVHTNTFYYSPKTTLNFIGGTNNIGMNTFSMNDYFRFNGGLKNLMRKGGASLQLSSDELGFSFLKDNRAKAYNSKILAFSINHSFSKKLQFQSFAIVSSNKTDLESNSTTTYISSALGQVEKTNSFINQNNNSSLVKLSASYEPNSKLHLNYDAVLQKGHFQEEKRIHALFNEINNRLKTESNKNPFSVKQNLEAYYALNRKHIFSFETQYLSKKQAPKYNIFSTEPVFESLLPFIDEGLGFTVSQLKEMKTYKSESILNYYIILNKKMHLNFTIGNTFLQQEFYSSILQTHADFTQISFTDQTYINAIQTQFLDYYTGAHYKIKLGKVILNPGVKFHFFNFKDTQLGRTNTAFHTKLLPDLYAKYHIKKTESLTLEYGLHTDFAGTNQRAMGITISDYKHLYKGNQNLTPNLYQQYTLQYSNYNMFSFSSIFAMLTYAKKFDEVKNEITYFGNNGVEKPINITQANDYLSLTASYEKHYKAYKTNIESHIRFSSIHNQINANLSHTKSSNQEYKLSIASNYSKAPNFEIGYSKGINTFSTTVASATFTTDKPFINIEASFLKNFLFVSDYSFTYYRNKAKTSQSKYAFFNADLYYQKEGSKFEFKLAANNLLNTKALNQDYFADDSIGYSEYYVQARYFLLSLKYGF